MNQRIRGRSKVTGPRAAVVALALSAVLAVPLPVRADSKARVGDDVTLTDANIAAIVLTANGIDIENGKLAITKSKNRTVVDFAKQMVVDHTAVNGKATALAERLRLVPEESRASRTLVVSADATRNRMRMRSGLAFDRAYVANEVAYHQAVIDLLDRTLVPGAENKDLKDLLRAVRPAFVAHLEHAKMIQAVLAK